MKKLKIDAGIEGDEIFFTIQRSKGLSLLEILGLLKHISNQINDTLKVRMKITKGKDEDEEEDI